jgi:hypothetical protein
MDVDVTGGGGVREHLAGHCRCPSPLPATESVPWRPSRRVLLLSSGEEQGCSTVSPGDGHRGRPCSTPSTPARCFRPAATRATEMGAAATRSPAFVLSAPPRRGARPATVCWSWGRGRRSGVRRSGRCPPSLPPCWRRRDGRILHVSYLLRHSEINTEITKCLSKAG